MLRNSASNRSMNTSPQNSDQSGYGMLVQSEDAYGNSGTESMRLVEGKHEDDENWKVQIFRRAMQFTSILRNMTLVRRNELLNLIKNEDWKLARVVCNENPTLAGLWTVYQGFTNGKFDSYILPLHQACALCPSEDIIQTLVLAYPRAIKEKETAFGRTPLHVACRSGASVGVIEALLTYFPDALLATDKLLRNPLHYALSNDTGYDVIRLLLDYNEECARQKDHRGWLPLHVASGAKTSPETMKLLIEAYPESITIGTKKGSTPLILAAAYYKEGTSQDKSEVLALLTPPKPDILDSEKDSLDNVIEDETIPHQSFSSLNTDISTVSGVLA